jgi:hypothetical protein
MRPASTPLVHGVSAFAIVASAFASPPVVRAQDPAPSAGVTVSLFAATQGAPSPTAQSAPPPSTPTGVAPPASPVPPSKAPLPNRANELLPAWLRVRGEFRERLEGFTGSGFVIDRNDAYSLSRFRFNATLTPGPLVSVQLQAQDARVAEKQVGPTAVPFRGTFDLRMAFADIGTATSRIAARVGRQELAYGEQRLVGHVSWLNTARTFDGARVTVRGARTSVDVFGASVVRILDQEFDTSGGGNRFYGAYATTTALVPQASVEPYLFWRGDQNVKSEAGPLADLGTATIGARFAGKLPARLDYSVEMAGQTGAVGSDSVSAWAGHWFMRESLPGSKAVKLMAEFNLATGDDDPTDGARGTFDQLYPTPHDKLGLSDQVGWKNIRHVRAALELSPGKKFLVNGGYHSWWLMEKNDALYNAGSAVLARVTGGAASAHVGHELDLQVSRPITPQLAMLAGISHIFPGAFLQEATPGASYTAPFLMLTYVFLADR